MSGAGAERDAVDAGRRARCGRRSENPAARRARRSPHRPAPDRWSGKGRRNRRPRSRGRVPARSNSTCQVSFSEPGLLRRRRDRKVASAGLSRERPGAADANRQRRRGGVAAPPARRPAALPNSCIERLEHAGGFLAARHAKVQPLLFLREQRVGIVLAVVAALSAILLRHRGHHAAAAAAGLRQASCARRAASSGRARARPSSSSAAGAAGRRRPASARRTARATAA